MYCNHKLHNFLIVSLVSSNQELLGHYIVVQQVYRVLIAIETVEHIYAQNMVIYQSLVHRHIIYAILLLYCQVLLALVAAVLYAFSSVVVMDALNESIISADKLLNSPVLETVLVLS